MRTVNLEIEMPSVHEARSWLSEDIAAARRDRVRVMKIIHGYGSSGRGGVLRLELRKSLAQMQKTGRIRAFIIGEEWDLVTATLKQFFEKCPELRQDSDLGKANRGITLILL